MKKVIAVLSIAIFAASIFSGCIDSSNGNKTDTGENFSFTTIDGEHKQLSDYRGKVVILDLMGVACSPCRLELIQLKKVSESYSKDQVAIISIDVWTMEGETAQDVRNLRESYKAYFGKELDWVFGIDDGTLWRNYVIDGAVPSLYIFDQEGKIYFKHAGLSVYDEIPPDWPDSLQDVPKLKPIIDELLNKT